MLLPLPATLSCHSVSSRAKRASLSTAGGGRGRGRVGKEPRVVTQQRSSRHAAPEGRDREGPHPLATQIEECTRNYCCRASCLFLLLLADCSWSRLCPAGALVVATSDRFSSRSSWFFCQPACCCAQNHEPPCMVENRITSCFCTLSAQLLPYLYLSLSFSVSLLFHEKGEHERIAFSQVGAFPQLIGTSAAVLTAQTLSEICRHNIGHNPPPSPAQRRFLAARNVLQRHVAIKEQRTESSSSASGWGSCTNTRCPYTYTHK